MTMQAMEFIRRFSRHILPKGFVRIRHFGILSSTTKRINIPAIKDQLPENFNMRKEPRKIKEYNPKLRMLQNRNHGYHRNNQQKRAAKKNHQFLKKIRQKMNS